MPDPNADVHAVLLCAQDEIAELRLAVSRPGQHLSRAEGRYFSQQLMSLELEANRLFEASQNFSSGH